MAATDSLSTGAPRRNMLVIPLVTVIAASALTFAVVDRPARALVGAGVAVTYAAAVMLWRRVRHRPLDAGVIARIDRWREDVDATVSTDVVASSVLDLARELSGARRAEIVLIREGVAWRLAAHGAEADERWRPLAEPLDLAGVHAAVARSGQVSYLGRAHRSEKPEHRRQRLELLGGAAPPALLAPLHGGHALGTLLVSDPVTRQFAPEAANTLQLVAAHATGALDTSLVAEEIRNAAARQLRTITTDALTGLPNRAEFVERVDAAARLSSMNLLMAVLLVNLDGFREINATFGHHVGDQLLMQFGMRLCDSLPVTATVARLGGDEFAVLVCELRDQQAVGRITGELLDDLARPYTVGGAALQLEASIGVALAPLHAHDAVALLQRADIAMVTAKRARSGAEIFDPSRGTDDSSHLQLLVDLRRAIEDNELSVVYQPKAALRTHEVRGVEALLRWQHATRGEVPPSEFIPIAEQTGLVHPLTRWVLRTVVAQQREWHDAGLSLEVAVNLSARNLLDDTLPGDIATLLDEYQMSPHLLRLEITESSLIVDPGRAEAVLAALHRLGVRFSVDDFGTGYASFAHLLKLPVDEIKIDRTFVSGLLERRSEAAIVRATVDLGRRLAITVTAEGVEDQETWTKLAELGCDLGQGFWLARPMDADALERWLDEHRSTDVAGSNGSPTEPTPAPA